MVLLLLALLWLERRLTTPEKPAFRLIHD